MEENIYTISELTRIIKTNLESNPELNRIWVRGEATNITYHSSGHIYFTMKDEKSVISAVFFKNANKNLSFKLEDGMSLFALGSINVFERRGSYQFIVTQVKLEGIGELQKKIEQLKKKLSVEGIFDPEKKRKIPYLPRRIGVVTSPTGAAIRDIIKVSMRRFSNIEIIIAPAKVQGENAAISITEGIKELNRSEWNIDLIIAGRGGGSFEDLMPFNEESVVRAFFNSRVPIISAVGHQIDHPISDDAADLAAATPSAAAEIAIPVKHELQDYIDHLGGRAYVALISYVREVNLKIDGIMELRSFKNPMDLIYNQELLLNDVLNCVTTSMKDLTSEKRNQFLSIPELSRLLNTFILNCRHRFSMALQNIDSLSPVSVLKRGYSIARDRDGNIVRSVEEVMEGDRLDMMLHDGSLNCSVNSINKEVCLGKNKS